MIRLALSLILVVFATPVFARQSDLTPGQGFEVEHYTVDLRPKLVTTAVSGSEAILIRGLADDLNRIAFSPNGLSISEAKADGQPVEVASTEAGIVFNLPRPLTFGETITLTFSFQGLPTRGVTAVPRGFVTSYFACDWMICLQDAPGDKAAFDLNLYLPAAVASYGVGRAEPPVAAADDLVLHRWRSTRPWSPYLFAFAAGDFPAKSAASIAGGLTYVNASGVDADLPALLDQTPHIAAFFADKAGLPLPDDPYVQLLTPDREAQETAAFSLIGKTELAREHDDPASAWVIAHEMAHQWWGNLVTCATWSDFWLNEGVATFMVAAWKEHSVGVAAYQAELDVARTRLARAREAGFDKPLTWQGRYPSLGVRRAVQYSKGALFLVHLREKIGDAAFWDGLRAYTRAHAGDVVTSRDFQTAMEASSGRDLQPVFDEWVYGVVSPGLAGVSSAPAAIAEPGAR